MTSPTPAKTEKEGPARLIDEDVAVYERIVIGDTVIMRGEGLRNIAEEINDALAPLSRKADLCGRMASALQALMPSAEFGNMEQSPPGFWDKEIKDARELLAEFDREG